MWIVKVFEQEFGRPRHEAQSVEFKTEAEAKHYQAWLLAEYKTYSEVIYIERVHR